MLSKKILGVKPSLTLAFSAKVKELINEGENIINFTVGEPDFGTPNYIKEAAIDSIMADKIKYTPASGLLSLKTAICDYYNSKVSLRLNESNIVLSTGAKQSIYNALSVILNVEDEVLIPSPYWLSYPEMVHLADGKSVFVNTSIDNDFKVTIEELNNYISTKTKCLIVNNPNNPTGAVYSKEEILEIAKWAHKNRVYVIADEIYSKLDFDQKYYSFLNVYDLLGEKLIVVNGFSKAYAMTGWRLGYTIADKEISTLMSNMQSHITSNPNTVSQYAAIAAINEENSVINDMINEFSERRDYIKSRLLEMGLEFVDPSGAFYVFVNIKRYKNTDSLELANNLLSDAKIAVVPGIVFGNDDYIRISYATSKELIQKGMDRLQEYINR